MNIRSLSTGGLPAGDLMVMRMAAISAHASSVNNKRTDIRFPLDFIVMNGREKTYPGIRNSSTRPRRQERGAESIPPDSLSTPQPKSLEDSSHADNRTTAIIP